jgi:putative ABC transport system ATP-binding protein
MRALREIVDGEHLTALVATHDPQLTALADDVHDLRDGMLNAARTDAEPDR